MVREVVATHRPPNCLRIEPVQGVAAEPRGLGEAGKYRIRVVGALRRFVHPHDLAERRNVVAVHEARESLQRRTEQRFVGLDLRAEASCRLVVEGSRHRAHVGAPDPAPEPRASPAPPDCFHFPAGT